MTPRPLARRWLSRLLIAPVLLWNVQCGLAFLAAPAHFVAGFELVGPIGEALVRGLGLLFLMWNVPYFVALLDPVRHRVSLCEALAMQAMALIGESGILWSLAGEHRAAAATLTRFIAFDAAGLILLALAVWASRQPAG